MNKKRIKPRVPGHQQILVLAIAAFEQGTDLRVTTKARYEDTILRIDGEEYIAEIKAWAQQATQGALIETVKRHPNGILIADYVNPKMADRLRDAEVEFIDTAGNAFIKTPFHHVQIKGNRKPEAVFAIAKPRKLRAFTAAGLKVTYAFLCQPDLVTAPYRTIAEVTDVALGTVGKVVDDLQEAGNLVEQDDARRLVRRESILKSWVDRYPAVLRHKLHLGVFQAEAVEWWQDFNVAKFGGIWGGEIAGAHYTDYLRPAVATVYIPNHMHLELVAAAHLRKMAIPSGDAGSVELLTPFWHIEGGDKGFVHPMLAYADLVATGDVRNLEVARKLYAERVTQHLR